MYRIWRCTIFLVAVLMPGVTAFGQPSFVMSGYVKDLFSVIRYYPGVTQVDNLIHNRLNAEYYPHDNWTVYGALRTRVFTGDQAALPGFQSLIDAGANDYFDLSLSGKIGDDILMHTYLDRLYVEYAKEKWQIRLGRQRINWGIHTVWNPNDLFNAFSFVDFDYEERPGSDALSVKYYTGALSSLEFAVRVFDDFDQATIAALWRTHTGEYDLQILSGVTEKHYVLGGGWAGNLGNWGFKGEMSAFAPVDEEGEFSVSGTVGWDYAFTNGMYIGFSSLFNSLGGSSQSLIDIFESTLSARNLYPYRWSFYANYGVQIHPLLNGSLAVVYSPTSEHPLFISPALTWSVATNLDLDLISQLAFFDILDNYEAVVQAYFLRLKWSF